MNTLLEVLSVLRARNISPKIIWGHMGHIIVEYENYPVGDELDIIKSIQGVEICDFYKHHVTVEINNAKAD